MNLAVYQYYINNARHSAYRCACSHFLRPLPYDLLGMHQSEIMQEDQSRKVTVRGDSRDEIESVIYYYAPLGS